MGASTMEKGVLKLVQPSRHVEIHRKPITAAEVMRTNPRHCVARPDVFQFPWVVVRPESVLAPGRAFHIVPNRTIYRLINARGANKQALSRQNKSQNNGDHHRAPKKTSPHKSQAGMTAKHQNHGHWFKIPVKCTVNPEEEDLSESCRRKSYYQSRPEVIAKIINMYKGYKHEELIDSRVEIRSFGNKEHVNRS